MRQKSLKLLPRYILSSKNSHEIFITYFHVWLDFPFIIMVWIVWIFNPREICPNLSGILESLELSTDCTYPGNKLLTERQYFNSVWFDQRATQIGADCIRVKSTFRRQSLRA